MARTFIGGLVGGIILFVIGFIFWATPLSQIAYSSADQAQNAALQTSLAQTLTPSGTGTYVVPAYTQAEGAVLYAKGPIATVHFNTSGYSPDDMSMLLPGFIFALVSGLLMAFGLSAVGGGRSFADVGRLVVLFSVGVTVWTILAMPIFNHYGWGYWVYSFIAETAALVAAGLVIARWFLPNHLPRHATVGASADEPRPSEPGPTEA